MTDPALAFNDPNGNGRFYRDPNGRYSAMPSITNIMREQNKPAINASNVKKAAEYAVENSDRHAQLTAEERVKLIKGSIYAKSEASAVGDIVHAWIERYVKGDPPSNDELNQAINSARWSYEQFLLFVQKYGPKWTGIEFTVWSNTYGYAGTMDNSFTINGMHVLCDTKTGKGVYPETAMQLAAGAFADFMFDDEGREVPLPRYDKFAVLHLRPRSFSLVPMENIPAAFDAFLALKKVFDWRLSYATQTVGLAPKHN